MRPREGQEDQVGSERASAIEAYGYAQIEQCASAGMELPHNSSTYTGEWISTALTFEPCLAQDEGKRSLPEIAINDSYKLCVQTFRSILSVDSDNESKSRLLPSISVVLMKDEIVKLLLWGDDLPMAAVDRSLDSAKDLKIKIVQYLLGIGRFLLQGMHIFKVS